MEFLSWWSPPRRVEKGKLEERICNKGPTHFYFWRPRLNSSFGLKGHAAALASSAVTDARRPGLRCDHVARKAAPAALGNPLLARGSSPVHGGRQ